MPGLSRSSTIRPDAFRSIPQSGPTPRGVLIVEDDPLTSEMLVDLLTEQYGPGTAVVGAPTLAAARRELAARPELEIVLLDHILPDGLGVEFLNELRPQFERRAAVLLTGAGSERLAAAAFQGGACDYLPKIEIDGAMLRQAIGVGLETLARRRRESRANDDLHRLRGEVDHYLRHLARYGGELDADGGHGRRAERRDRPAGPRRRERRLRASRSVSAAIEQVHRRFGLARADRHRRDAAASGRAA
ncbi:MAG: response regulator [Pirellulales bacterium]